MLQEKTIINKMIYNLTKLGIKDLEEIKARFSNLEYIFRQHGLDLTENNTYKKIKSDYGLIVSELQRRDMLKENKKTLANHLNISEPENQEKIEQLEELEKRAPFFG